MQRDATDQLHVKVPHAERAQRRLAHHGERLRQQVIQRGALFQARAELVRLGAQRLVGEGLDLVLKLVRGAHVAPVAAHDALVTAAENAGEELSQRVTRLRKNGLPNKYLGRTAGRESGVLYAIDAKAAQLVLGRSEFKAGGWRWG